MIISAIDSIGAAPSGEEETVVGASLFIEEVCSGVANVEFGVAPGEGSLFVLLVLRANVLAIPEVVLFISLFVGVVIG